MKRWFKPEDKLPGYTDCCSRSEFVIVLVCINDGNVTEAIYCNSMFKRFGDNITDLVSHWMYMPKGPKA